MRRQPVRDLFDRGPELRRKDLKVIDEKLWSVLHESGQ